MGGPADTETPTLSAARIASIIAGAASTVLGTALAALYSLTPAANKGIVFTSGSAAATFDLPAAARTFLGTFATTIALAATLQTSTGRDLNSGIAAPGTLPTTSMATVQILPTNVTEAVYANDARGVTLCHVSATASGRAGGYMAAGTSVTTWLDAACTCAAGSIPDGIGGVALDRPVTDNRRLHFGFSQAAGNLRVLALYLYTDKDTFSAARLAAPIGIAGPIKLRLRETGGNVEAAYSTDGTNWTTVYSAASATAWGTAGAATRAGEGITSSASATVMVTYQSLVIA